MDRVTGTTGMTHTANIITFLSFMLRTRASTVLRFLHLSFNCCLNLKFNTVMEVRLQRFLQRQRGQQKAPDWSKARSVLLTINLSQLSFKPTGVYLVLEDQTGLSYHHMLETATTTGREMFSWETNTAISPWKTNKYNPGWKAQTKTSEA